MKKDAPWLSDREERAWRGLQFMQMRLTAALARVLGEDSDLSYPDYVVLVALTGEPEGRMRPSELGHAIGWEQSRLSHQVTRMSERGLVKKEKCPSDQRGAFVVATEEGRRKISEAAPGHVQAVRRLFIDQLTNAELDHIARAAEKVLAALDADHPVASTHRPEVP